MNKLKRLICRVFGHRYTAVWEREYSDWSDEQRDEYTFRLRFMTENSVIGRCSRCGDIYE